MKDEIHDHPTVQGLAKWQKRHHWLIAILAVALVVVTTLWVHDYFFVPRSVM